MRGGWLAGVALAAMAAGGAAAQTSPAPGTGVLTLPPLGTPGTGTGAGTGGAGNSRLGGSVGGVPGMGHVSGPASTGIMTPGVGANDYSSASGPGRAAPPR